MGKMRLVWMGFVIVMIAALSFFPAGANAQKKVYISGTQSLTGPYAEDSAAILTAFEDYAKYVNETNKVAAGRNEKWPADITVEVLWRDDELKPAKALAIYEELKAK